MKRPRPARPARAELAPKAHVVLALAPRAPVVAELKATDEAVRRAKLMRKPGRPA
jgi:hypothetical protein